MGGPVPPANACEIRAHVAVARLTCCRSFGSRGKAPVGCALVPREHGPRQVLHRVRSNHWSRSRPHWAQVALAEATSATDSACTTLLDLFTCLLSGAWNRLPPLIPVNGGSVQFNDIAPEEAFGRIPQSGARERS